MKYSKGLSPSFVKEYEAKPVPWGPLGYVTYKRTYSRLIPKYGRLEEWHETCARACNGLIEIGGLFTQKELEFLFDTMFNLHGSVSGRALWQLGTETVTEYGSDSLQNCWVVACNHLSAFPFTFNQLMLGGGVGFNILPEYVYELPPVAFNPVVERVDTYDCDFIVPDNREGWVELLERILDSFFVSGKRLQYNTRAIRPAGQRIKRFGGVASGSETLVWGVTKIVDIIRSRLGQKLRPIDCLDIMNLIGVVVRSGNVRRSSEIGIGSPEDKLFILAKNWERQQIPDWRTMSNNSIALDYWDDLDSQYFWDGYEGNGEPYGFVNLRNCREFGRLCDGRSPDADPFVVGVNPCGETPNENREPCNLAEIFISRCKDLRHAQRVAAILFKACKTVANHRFSDPITQEVVSRNMRTGVSLTGVMECPWIRDGKMLDGIYQHIKRVDEEYSRLLGISTSRKRTTIKPSGTLSLLPGVSPGMHAVLSRYILRTVRFPSNHPLVPLLRDNGYIVEPRRKLDGSPDLGTQVVYFPAKHSDDAILSSEMDVIEELEIQKLLQTYWADNSVSATHYYRPEDVPRLKHWMATNYDDGVKATSFLLETGHGFDQAPINPITEEEYHAEVAKVKPITHCDIYEETDDYDVELECEGGMCNVR